jgi:hypothetical protein
MVGRFVFKEVDDPPFDDDGSGRTSFLFTWRDETRADGVPVSAVLDPAFLKAVLPAVAILPGRLADGKVAILEALVRLVKVKLYLDLLEIDFAEVVPKRLEGLQVLVKRDGVGALTNEGVDHLVAPREIPLAQVAIELPNPALEGESSGSDWGAHEGRARVAGARRK